MTTTTTNPIVEVVREALLVAATTYADSMTGKDREAFEWNDARTMFAWQLMYGINNTKAGKKAEEKFATTFVRLMERFVKSLDDGMTP